MLTLDPHKMIYQTCHSYHVDRPGKNQALLGTFPSNIEYYL